MSKKSPPGCSYYVTSDITMDSIGKRAFYDSSTSFMIGDQESPMASFVKPKTRLSEQDLSCVNDMTNSEVANAISYYIDRIDADYWEDELNPDNNNKHKAVMKLLVDALRDIGAKPCQ